MNSFRAFKLKLRMGSDTRFNIDGEQTVDSPGVCSSYSALELSRHLPPSLRMDYDSFPTSDGRPEGTGQCRREPTKEEDIHIHRYPPISSLLSRIDSFGDQSRADDVRIPRNIQRQTEITPIIFMLPNKPTDGFPSLVDGHQSVYSSDGWEDQARSQGSSKLDVPKVTPSAENSSPPSSDSESSSKCSSPSSTDSGYSQDIDQNATLNELEMEAPPDGDAKEGCFKCRYCKRTFSYLCHLKVHERVHTGEKPYSCKFCSQRFSQLGSLTVHMRIHTGAKPYQCGQCSKKFRHVNSLRRHQRQVHNMTSGQIAASIDKIKEDTRELLSMQHCPSVIPGSSPYKRKLSASPTDHEQIHRQHILQSYGSYSDYLDMRTLWKNSRQDPYLSRHRKSKFLSHLQDKIQKASVSETIPASESSSLEPDAAKATPPPKTWRPFSTDEEVEALSTKRASFEGTRLLASDTFKSGQFKQRVSVPMMTMQSAGNPSVCDYSQQLIQGCERWGGYLLPSDTVMSPAGLWPLNLPRFAGYPMQSHAYADNNNCAEVEWGIHSSQDKDHERSIDSDQYSSREKRDREGSLSDEGFSSSCSTGNADARSPDSSITVSQETDESLTNSVVELSSESNHHNEKMKEGRQLSVVTHTGWMKAERKWSEDSGNYGT